jgi:abhydrolase domain-containing protein 2
MAVKVSKNCLFLSVFFFSEKSQFYCANSKFLEEILKKVPDLSEPYIPTRFWGFSGHIQTIVQVKRFSFRHF